MCACLAGAWTVHGRCMSGAWRTFQAFWSEPHGLLRVRSFNFMARTFVEVQMLTDVQKVVGSFLTRDRYFYSLLAEQVPCLQSKGFRPLNDARHRYTRVCQRALFTFWCSRHHGAGFWSTPVGNKYDCYSCHSAAADSSVYHKSAVKLSCSFSLLRSIYYILSWVFFNLIF